LYVFARYLGRLKKICVKNQKQERVVIMLITLAQALKEKNRIVGEISKLWTLVNNENSCWEYHTRSISVEETMKTINSYTEKLIELKTKIGKANEGNLQYMYALDEYKSKISKLEKLDTAEEIRYRLRNFGILVIFVIENFSALTVCEYGNVCRSVLLCCE
jgi:cysteinyl-tRNA synthetase